MRVDIANVGVLNIEVRCSKQDNDMRRLFKTWDHHFSDFPG